MRRLICILILLAVPALLLAEPAAAPKHPQTSDVAHGAEKEAHKTAHPDEAHGAPGHPPKTYLGIPGWILKLVNMILFISLLAYLVGGPVKKAFRERSEAIRRAADEARARREKSDQLAGDIQARLSQIEQEVRSIRERAEAEAERQKRELLAAAEAEAAKILAAARSEVDNKLKSARHELTEYAGQLASERAEAILRERITEQDQKKLFNDSLRELNEVQA